MTREDFQALAVHEQVHVIIESEPDRVWCAEDISQRIAFEGGAFRGMSSALSRLTREGHIERVKHGRYRAKRSGGTP